MELFKLNQCDESWLFQGVISGLIVTLIQAVVIYFIVKKIVDAKLQPLKLQKFPEFHRAVHDLCDSLDKSMSLIRILLKSVPPTAIISDIIVSFNEEFQGFGFEDSEKANDDDKEEKIKRIAVQIQLNQTENVDVVRYIVRSIHNSVSKKSSKSFLNILVSIEGIFSEIKKLSKNLPKSISFLGKAQNVISILPFNAFCNFFDYDKHIDGEYRKLRKLITKLEKSLTALCLKNEESTATNNVINSYVNILKSIPIDLSKEHNTEDRNDSKLLKDLDIEICNRKESRKRYEIN